MSYHFSQCFLQFCRVTRDLSRVWTNKLSQTVEHRAWTYNGTDPTVFGKKHSTPFPVHFCA